jgi:hypothetical protein
MKDRLVSPLATRHAWRGTLHRDLLVPAPPAQGVMTRPVQKQVRGSDQMGRVAGSVRESETGWVAKSKTTRWLNRLRAAITLCVAAMLFIWDMCFCFGPLLWRLKISKIVCHHESILNFAFPNHFLNSVQTQCSTGGGEPTASLVLFVTKSFLSGMLATLSMALLGILMNVQPSARKFNAFSDEARKQRNLKLYVIFCLCIWSILMPVGPVFLVLFLLNRPEYFAAGLMEEIACSGSAFIL